jgi:hypothetical protein
LALGRISRLFFIIQQAPQPPFWWNDALSPATVAYGIVLAVAGALIIGVVPALKATGGAVGPRLGRLPAGGGGGLHFGGIWTVVIVLQVALSVALIPLAVSLGDARSGLLEPRAGTALEDSVAAGFPADEYLTAELGRDRSVPPRTPESRSVVVNEAFVDNVLGGRNPVGGQLRFPERGGRRPSSRFRFPGLPSRSLESFATPRSTRSAPALTRSSTRHWPWRR